LTREKGRTVLCWSMECNMCGAFGPTAKYPSYDKAQVGRKELDLWNNRASLKPAPSVDTKT
jgi:hypothetical protein